MIWLWEDEGIVPFSAVWCGCVRGLTSVTLRLIIWNEQKPIQMANLVPTLHLTIFQSTYFQSNHTQKHLGSAVIHWSIKTSCAHTSANLTVSCTIQSSTLGLPNDCPFFTGNLLPISILRWVHWVCTCRMKYNRLFRPAGGLLTALDSPPQSLAIIWHFKSLQLN